MNLNDCQILLQNRSLLSAWTTSKFTSTSANTRITTMQIYYVFNNTNILCLQQYKYTISSTIHIYYLFNNTNIPYLQHIQIYHIFNNTNRLCLQQYCIGYLLTALLSAHSMNIAIILSHKHKISKDISLPLWHTSCLHICVSLSGALSNHCNVLFQIPAGSWLVATSVLLFSCSLTIDL